ncbi:MAG: hypothetical protein AAF492_19535, partial [Verrucomicrobiota bacterium]
MKWDPEKPGYLRAFKADHTGHVERDGFWFEDDVNWAASSLTLHPGEGFWIGNRQSVTQAVYLVGRVVLEAAQTNRLPAGFNVLGFPFSTSIALTNSALAESASVEAGLRLKMGEGYWAQPRPAGILSWIELRPYASPFPLHDDPPQILAMVPGGDAIRLTVSAHADPEATYNIYYKDLGPLDFFDAASGWRKAAEGVTADGPTFSWTDHGGHDPDGRHRPGVNAVFARFYFVARGDLDGNGDGIADAAEKFVVGKEEQVAKTSVISSPLTIGPNDTTYDGDCLIVNNTTLTIDGFHEFECIHLNNSTLTHSPGYPGGMSLVVSGIVEVSSSSEIDVTARGDLASLLSAGCAGGSYGGAGEAQCYGHTIPAYGHADAPAHPGSGGAGLGEARGGGMVRISAHTIDLVASSSDIRANGGPSTSSGPGRGGGAGGSIWLDVHELRGIGDIQADGDGAFQQGDGGGGRICIYYDEIGSYDASGLSADGHNRSEDGTIRMFDRNADSFRLVTSTPEDGDVINPAEELRIVFNRDVD